MASRLEIRNFSPVIEYGSDVGQRILTSDKISSSGAQDENRTHDLRITSAFHLNEHEPVRAFAQSLFGLYLSLNQHERARTGTHVPCLFPIFKLFDVHVECDQEFVKRNLQSSA